MERTYWSKRQGFGYVGADLDSLKIAKKPVIINGELIEPESFTTISGFFNRPVRYMGIDNSDDFKDSDIMLFYLGTSKELFENHYVDCICWISEKRLFIKYGEGFGRDYNFIKGKWK